MSVDEDNDGITLAQARAIANGVRHRPDGTSQAFARLEDEIGRLTTNEFATAVWMNSIDDILGCEFEIDKPSGSGKVGYKCRVCGHYSNAPVRGSVQPCREKVSAARRASKIGEGN